MNWQLNRIHYPIYNLGEGKRIGIWVQGCNLGCRGCISQTTWKKNAGRSISIVELFNWVLNIKDGFDGITISGGEPFQQYEQLIAFLFLIKNKTKLEVQCYTGYSLDEIQNLFPDKLFAKYIDVLVDGRYIESLHENTNTKGSTNQSIYKFINEVPVIQKNFNFSNKWSLQVSESNQIYMVGIPQKNELITLCNDLRKNGINKKFK